MKKIVKGISIVLCLMFIFCIPVVAQSIDNNANQMSDEKMAKLYEMYGENNVKPDENAEENAKRTAQKLEDKEKFMKKIGSMDKSELDETDEMRYSLEYDIYNNRSLDYDGTLYYVYVPYHSQETSYWCGPASGQQTIDSWIECYQYVGDLPSQDDLADEMNTTTSGTSVYDYRDTLNEYLDDYYATSCIADDDDKYMLKDASIIGGSYDSAVTYLVVKNILPYYSGTTASGHYISGSGIWDYDDYDVDTVLLKDCNSNPTYGGLHEVEFNDLHAALVEYYETRSVANLIW